MLARVFEGKTDGFYVDVGAADPEFLSVTKWLYDLGWRGINVEPNDSLYEKLTAARPRDVNLKCGAGASRKIARYFEAAIGELSSFDAQASESAEQSGVGGQFHEIQVLPLTDILDQYCGRLDIDFIKIDVEGWERDVLLGLDLRKYRPTIFVVEATLPQSRVESHVDWEKILLDQNYTFVYFDGLNRFYVDDRRIDLKRHFELPPNIFDAFKVHQHVVAELRGAQLDRALAQDNSAIAHLNNTLVLRDAQIDRLNNTLTLRDVQIERLSNTVALRDLQLERTRASLESRATEIEHLDATLAEKEGVIARSAADVASLSRELAEKDRAITLSAADAERLSQLLTAKTAEGARCSTSLSRLTEEFAAKEREIAWGAVDVDRLSDALARRDKEIARFAADNARLSRLLTAQGAEIARVSTDLERRNGQYRLAEHTLSNLYDGIGQILSVIGAGQIDSPDAARRGLNRVARILASRSATLSHFVALMRSNRHRLRET